MTGAAYRRWAPVLVGALILAGGIVSFALPSGDRSLTRVAFAPLLLTAFLLPAEALRWLLLAYLATPPWILGPLGSVASIPVVTIVVSLLVVISFAARGLTYLKNANGGVYLSVLVAVSLVSLLHSGNWGFEPARGQWLTLASYALIVLAVTTATRDDRTGPSFVAQAQAAVLASALGVSLIAVGQYAALGGQVGPAAGVGATGLLSHRTHLGYIAAVGFALAYPRLLVAGTRSKPAWLAVILLLLAGIATSMSRSAWLSSVGSVLVAGLALRNRGATVLTILILVLGIALLSPIPHRILSASTIDWFTGRLALWDSLLLMAKGNFLAGLGSGSIFLYQGPAGFTDAFAFRTAENPFVYPHNDFLYLLLELGVVGPVLLAAALLAWTKAHIGLLRSSGVSAMARVSTVAALASLPAGLMAHLVDNALFIPSVTTRFFVVMAALPRSESSRRERRRN